MELQVPSLTNIKMQLTKTLSVLVLIFLNACINKKNEKAIAVVNNIQFSFYNADSVEVFTKQGITYINKQIASGYLFLLSSDKNTMQKEGYINGKKQGVCYRKYPNHHYQYLHKILDIAEHLQASFLEGAVGLINKAQEETFQNLRKVAQRKSLLFKKHLPIFAVNA